jgi:hypothetical protein
VRPIARRAVPQRRLELRITGLREDDLRRWRRRHAGVGATVLPILFGSARRLIATSAVVVTSVWAVRTAVPHVEVAQSGEMVRGRRVLLVQDLSGSMDQYQAVVAARLATLRDAGMYSAVGCTLGNDEFGDLMACAETIGRDVDVDGVYIFADFDAGDWTYTPDGLRRVAQELESRGVRVYLETVRDDPHPVLRTLAENSGGTVIRAPTK